MKPVMAILFSALLLIPAIPLSSAVDDSITDMTDSEIQNPLKQLQNGVPPDEILCRDDRILMLRPNSEYTCVYTTSVENLQMQEWQLSVVAHMQDSVMSNSTTLKITSEDFDQKQFGHGSGQKLIPPEMIITFPTHVKVGQTFMINYTYSWITTDQDGNVKPIASMGPLLEMIGDELQKPPTEIEIAELAGFFEMNFTMRWSMPDEFILISPEPTRAVNFLGDAHDPHVLKLYLYDLPYDFTKIHEGQFIVKMDKEMLHDIDIVAWNINGERIELYPKKQSSGIKFVTEHVDASEIWDYDNGRYSVIPPHTGPYVPPQPKEESIVVGASVDEGPMYLEKIHWDSFAIFLKDLVQQNENPQNMTRWLLDQNLTEKFVNDFLTEYPEFKTQNIPNGVMGQSSPPTSLFVIGKLLTYDRDNKVIPMHDVKAVHLKQQIMIFFIMV